MRTNELTAFASKRMRGAVTPAASLVLALLLLGFGLALVSRAVSILLAILFSQDASDALFGTVLPASLGSVLSLLFVLPLHLGMRRWIWLLDEDILPLREAFCYWALRKRFGCAVAYVTVNALIWFFTLFFCFFPAAFVWAATAVIQLADIWTAVAVVLGILLFVLGCVFSGYILSGTFLSSYCLIAGFTKNPFKAAALSFKLMRGHRAKLFALFFHLVPYFLLSLTVVLLPFTVPHIESSFTLWAKERIAEQLTAEVYSESKEEGEYVFTE